MTVIPDGGESGWRIVRRSLYAVLIGGLAIGIAVMLPSLSRPSKSDAIRVVAGSVPVAGQGVTPRTMAVPRVPASAASPDVEQLVPLPQPSAPARGTAMPTDAEWAQPFDALRNQQ